MNDGPSFGSLTLRKKEAGDREKRIRRRRGPSVSISRRRWPLVGSTGPRASCRVVVFV